MLKQQQAAQKIRQFDERFGEGHFAFACQAAFPIGFTPDLLYQLWANFRNFKGRDGKAGETALIAVSDLLLSPLCIRTGKDVFEMDITVRVLLLEELRKDRFAVISRMEEIAYFIVQYLDSMKEGFRHESLRETLYWNTLVTLEPEKAFGQITRKLTESIHQNDEGEIFRLRNLLESFSYQEKGVGQESNSRFYKLLNFTKALKASLLNYPGELVQQQLQMSGAWAFTTDASKAKSSIKLPLLQKMVGTLEANQPESEEPATMKIEIKEIFAILIGIDEYPADQLKLAGCVNDIDAYEDFLHQRYHSDPEWDLYIHKLTNEEATAEKVRRQIEDTLQRAGEEDFVFIAFSGHSVKDQAGLDFTSLSLYDTGLPGQPNFEPFSLESQLTTNQEASIILSIDVSNSSSVLTNIQNNVVLLASSGADQQANEMKVDEETRGTFSYYLIETLQQNQGALTYAQLIAGVSAKVEAKHWQTPALIGAARQRQKRPFRESLLSEDPVRIKIREAASSNFRSLDLSGFGLTALPEELYALTNLQELNLSDNQLVVIPEQLGTLKGLREIGIKNNPVANLPAELIQKLSATGIKRFYDGIANEKVAAPKIVFAYDDEAGQSLSLELSEGLKEYVDQQLLFPVLLKNPRTDELFEFCYANRENEVAIFNFFIAGKNGKVELADPYGKVKLWNANEISQLLKSLGRLRLVITTADNSDRFAAQLAAQGLSTLGINRLGLKSQKGKDSSFNKISRFYDKLVRGQSVSEAYVSTKR